LDVQYFCAQTLRTKVQRDFEELPSDAVISLRDSLITLLFRFSKGAPPVRTQLCLAVASMAAHLPSQHWDGSGIIRWLLQRCQSVPQDVAMPCLLEMLIVLPQEATSHKVATRPERRRHFLIELQQQAPEALQVWCCALYDAMCHTCSVLAHCRQPLPCCHSQSGDSCGNTSLAAASSTRKAAHRTR
jgi:transportin-3